MPQATEEAEDGQASPESIVGGLHDQKRPSGGSVTEDGPLGHTGTASSSKDVNWDPGLSPSYGGCCNDGSACRAQANTRAPPMWEEVTPVPDAKAG